MPKYVQPLLPGFEEAKPEEREELISRTESQIFLAKQFCRFDKMQKLAKNDNMKRMLEKAKMETIKLMQRV